jgi:hypothetical protein
MIVVARKIIFFFENTTKVRMEKMETSHTNKTKTPQKKKNSPFVFPGHKKRKKEHKKRFFLSRIYFLYNERNTS